MTNRTNVSRVLLPAALVATALAAGSLLQAQDKPTSAPAAAQQHKIGEEYKTASGLRITEVAQGDGGAKTGDMVWVHYTGTLTNGTVFDSSRDRGPIDFPLGGGRVIRGWDEGIVGMRVGDKRKLVIPPELGYGAQDQGPIPANSTLVFDVELVGIRRGG